jgi:hypothetical protein
LTNATQTSATIRTQFLQDMTTSPRNTEEQ